jgi:hypothetical protein
MSLTPTPQVKTPHPRLPRTFVANPRGLKFQRVPVSSKKRKSASALAAKLIALTHEYPEFAPELKDYAEAVKKIGGRTRESIRHEIVVLFERYGDMEVADVIEYSGLSPWTVRQTLSQLVESGTLQLTKLRGRRGRPRLLYSLST